MSTPEHRIESLLLHDGFVRSLARSLIADPHAAEDVAQETWVAALEGSANAASLPRWLSGVVRNLAGKVGRGAHRRERREQDAARPEATPSGEEILEREAARSRVVAAVLALEEPYRASVLLRYFEGLPPRAIAARQGVPVETVRTRLKRALEMLRARLDREYGERGAWSAALLPLTRPTSAALAPLSAFAVTLPFLLAASAGVLTIAGLYLLVVRNHKEPVEPPARAAAMASGETVPPVGVEQDELVAPSSRSAVAVEEPSGTPALSAASGSLRVHVTWSDGTPAQGIHARIESQELESPAFRALEAWTDESGSLALAQVPCGSTWVTLDRGCDDQVEVRAGSESTLDVEIPRGFDLEGFVVDREGVPVSGADLWLSDENDFTGTIVGRSRANGSFRLRSCSYGHSIGARAAGHAPSLLVGLSGDEGTTVPVRLVLLGAGGEVAGRVLDPSGDPAAGATVLVGSEMMMEFKRVFVPGEGELTGTAAPPAVVRTDEDGRFLAKGIAPGRTEVVVRADGLALWRGEGELGEHDRVTLDIQLMEEARLSGHVLDAQGQPVAEAMVMLQNRYGRIDPGCTTRADGSFELGGLAPGSIQVTAEAPAGVRASTTLVGQAGDELTWEAVVGLGFELRGRVLAESGAALAGWEVTIQDELQLSPQDLDSSQTDGEGRFFIVGLHDRPHRVVIQAPGDEGTFDSTILGGIRPGIDEQLFRVADAELPSVRFRGLVADEAGGVPANLRIELQRLDIPLIVPLKAHSQGRFDLGPYAPGSFVLRVCAPRYPEHLFGPRHLAPGETWDLGTIELHGAGALLVRVQRPPGTESLEPWFRILQGSFDRMRLEPAGEVWRCEALAPGSLRLSMAGAGVAAATIPFEIRTGETTELVLPLRPGLHREILVTVTTEVGARRPVLRLTSAAGEVVLEEEMWGRLPREFQHHPYLPPGRYRVEIAFAGGPRAETELEVAAGVLETEPLLLELR